ncbi:hypothetical protein TREMEDRAFT_63942 [Tremella mesenterica DSM 1558]|uniref:uncharacterized protein n=1 Tax=Tremella mesenterica (strain ATCC 24925 / CBS 8224 / DSM 1558 / NBRC 9311 / NRRL Y-6157 / RJB 2259-6 / UBC 559-6) TaxID=578456 RepID=UPI0003F499C2|nr:uncharacterized protein TREMEDRAFT_63942 [Tremella mesenterica DSM 1558]EIW68054.1 hypothetical protein TREMEDRAFT_63942 [Tremella mesenterica DSM 1558]
MTDSTRYECSRAPSGQTNPDPSKTMYVAVLPDPAGFRSIPLPYTTVPRYEFTTIRQISHLHLKEPCHSFNRPLRFCVGDADLWGYTIILEDTLRQPDRLMGESLQLLFVETQKLRLGFGWQLSVIGLKQLTISSLPSKLLRAMAMAMACHLITVLIPEYQTMVISASVSTLAPRVTLRVENRKADKPIGGSRMRNLLTPVRKGNVSQNLKFWSGDLRWYSKSEFQIINEEGGQIPKSWDCCGYTDDPDDTDTESSCPSLAVVHLYKTVMAQFRDRHPSWSDATPFSVTDALFRSVMYVLRHEPELKVQPGYSIQFEYDPNGELKEYMRDRITALEESRIMYSIFTSLARAQVTAECSFPPLPAVKSEGDDVESQCYTLTCVP